MSWRSPESDRICRGLTLRSDRPSQPVACTAHESSLKSHGKWVCAALVLRCNAKATLCQNLVSENVAAPKEKALNQCGLRLYRVGGIGLETPSETRGICPYCGNVAPNAPPLELNEVELGELIENWKNLTPQNRSLILEIVQQRPKTGPNTQ